MKSIREFYKIGMGPSSSHTMGPRKAAEIFGRRNPKAHSFRVYLYSALAFTGKGHLTDFAIISGLEPHPVQIVWEERMSLPRHPNGMKFEALDEKEKVLSSWTVYSVGGGEIRDDKDFDNIPPSIYPLTTMSQILAYTKEKKISLWEYVEEVEGEEIWEYLSDIWKAMQSCIESGLSKRDILPGTLQLERKARRYYKVADTAPRYVRRA